MNSPQIQEVAVDVAASPQEVVAVREAFARAGFSVEVNASIVYRSTATEIIPWIVLVDLLIPLPTFMRSFVSEIAKEAAKDSYPTLKQWVLDVFAARKSSAAEHGSIRLSEPEGTYLEIEAGIPEEALDALAEIDWDKFVGDYYIAWDGDSRRWVAPRKRT